MAGEGGGQGGWGTGYYWASPGDPQRDPDWPWGETLGLD